MRFCTVDGIVQTEHYTKHNVYIFEFEILYELNKVLLISILLGMILINNGEESGKD